MHIFKEEECEEKIINLKTTLTSLKCMPDPVRGEEELGVVA